MKSRARIGGTGAVALLAALALAGCAAAPEAELEAAVARLAEARSAGADVYAPQAYGEAEKALADARAEIETQQGKFRPMQRFEKSRQLIAATDEAARRAKDEAGAGRQAARGEAQAAIDAARSALTAAAAALATAPVGKDSRADLEAMQADVEAYGASLAEAEQALADDDPATARQRAEQVRQEAEAISADIARARRKTQPT